MKNTAVISFVVLLAACSGADVPASTPAPAPKLKPTVERPAADDMSYDEKVLLAQGYIDAGNAVDAESVAREDAAAEPTRPDAYALVGRALLFQNKLAESAAHYEKARALGIKERRVFVELASVYDVSGAYDKAIDVYTAFLAEYPDDVEMRHQYGLTLLLNERYDEAVKALAAAHKKAPGEAQLGQDYGYALLRAQRVDEAATLLKKVVEAEPRRAEAHLYLGQAYAAQGDLQRAVTALDSAVALSKKDLRALRTRARLRALVGDHEGALTDYDLLLQAKKNDPSALLGKAGALLFLGRLDEAKGLIDAVHGAVGDNPLIDQRRAQLAWRSGDKKSVAVIEQLADAQPNNIELWRDLNLAAKKFKLRKIERKAKGQLKKLGAD